MLFSCQVLYTGLVFIVGRFLLLIGKYKVKFII